MRCRSRGLQSDASQVDIVSPATADYLPSVYRLARMWLFPGTAFLPPPPPSPPAAPLFASTAPAFKPQPKNTAHDDSIPVRYCRLTITTGDCTFLYISLTGSNTPLRKRTSGNRRPESRARRPGEGGCRTLLPVSGLLLIDHLHPPRRLFLATCCSHCMQKERNVFIFVSATGKTARQN